MLLSCFVYLATGVSVIMLMEYKSALAVREAFREQEIRDLNCQNRTNEITAQVVNFRTERREQRKAEILSALYNEATKLNRAEYGFSSELRNLLHGDDLGTVIGANRMMGRFYGEWSGITRMEAEPVTEGQLYEEIEKVARKK